MAQAKTDKEREQIALKHIRDAVRSVRFGTVMVIVQDGVVIQVDRTEKTRIDYSRSDVQAEGSGI